ncbi:inner centromere protein, ARK-binding domain protein [Rhodotorula toruloides]|uniref:Inner centromere protein, ARK-binding domain protein n=1 Tax=Rhodotorula toruloides TaxID=5286 RepID=A0A511KAP1_RHOTO|nr:inner centromere protein, ARK-binding domain protein [Rhodotorula toruloides]
MLSGLASLAHDSLQAQIDDYTDAHRWMDSFFEKLAPKGQQNAGGSRLAMSELMKTPGRKRVATASSALRTLASSKKDPVATLLFPAPASPKRSPAIDKENTPAASSGQSTSRRLLSPLGHAASLNKAKAVSPLRAPSPKSFGANNQSARDSPAPVGTALADDIRALDFAPSLDLDEPEPFEVPVHELSNVMEEDEEDEDEEEEARQVSNVLTKKEDSAIPGAANLDEQEKADLSIIGEEEEDEGTSTASLVTAPSTQPPSLVGAPTIVPETQFSQRRAASPKQAGPTRALSPQPRSVSGASSIAPEADAEEMSVPLNDAPSTIRSEALSSSLSSSTLRTPGGSSVSRFTLGTYSAARLGSIGLGSSPPPTAPATVGPAVASSRISTGGAGPRQLNFVGLPKKSLGHGLGLGRNWLASGPESQGSTASQTSSVPSAVAEPAQSGSSTATGATKRKSLDGTVDAAKKAPKLSQVPAGDVEQDEARKRREALANRIQSMQARQSNLGGRTSNVAGPFGGVPNIFGSAKPISTTPSLFHSSSVAPATKPLTANAPILPSSSSVNITAELNGPAGRRPSVMDRVKSFESNTTGTEHVHPPSPSKIPAAFSTTAHRSPRPNSPPPAFSSGRFASPPVSPRTASRTAPSGLPVATFGSPRSAQLVPPAAHPASPRLGGLARSPSSFVSASISSILSPPRQAVKIPVVEPKSPARSPVRVANTPPTAVVRSTTPVASPPGMGLADMLKKAEGVRSFEMNDELEDEEEEEEDDDRPAIRAINASTPASAVVMAQAEVKVKAEAEQARQQREAEAKRAAEQAARDLEEQEAQREREEMLKKRLPSLPAPKQQDDDDESESEDGDVQNKAILTKAVREDLTSKASPSRVVMPGGFGNGSSSHEHGSSAEASDMEDDEAMNEDEDRTTMSTTSSVTASSTLHYSQNHHPFKPVTAHKAPQASRPASKASIASTASTSTTFGLNRSTSATPASAIKKAKPDVKAVQRMTAAAKKEKEERDRKAAAANDKRSMLQKKQQEERKVKADGLEKKRKEREEQASKAKANPIRGVKPKTGDEEPAKKRKIEPEARSRLDPKKATQPGRAMTPSASSQQLSSSMRTGAMGPPAVALNKSAGLSSMLNKSNGASAALNKSAGASAMIGHSFMSNKINLPGSASSSTARPANPTKTFGSTAQTGARSQQPTPQAKPEPEPFIELPDVDSEYSDSEDEDAQEAKKAAMPRWAQSPNLARALELQQTINPDEIFGPIPKLSIRDMFRNAESAARLRARTSSAQWEGTDALTQADIERYQRAMGFARTETRPPPPQ